MEAGAGPPGYGQTLAPDGATGALLLQTLLEGILGGSSRGAPVAPVQSTVPSPAPHGDLQLLLLLQMQAQAAGGGVGAAIHPPPPTLPPAAAAAAAAAGTSSSSVRRRSATAQAVAAAPSTRRRQQQQAAVPSQAALHPSLLPEAAPRRQADTHATYTSRHQQVTRARM